MSSAQIWNARSAGLPLAARPPVSSMLKPILIGSAACASGKASASNAVAARVDLTIPEKFICVLPRYVVFENFPLAAGDAVHILAALGQAVFVPTLTEILCADDLAIARRAIDLIGVARVQRELHE